MAGFSSIAGGLVFAASTIYLLLALVGVFRFRERALAPLQTPPVTLLVPCHGVPVRFRECLDSICRQDYAGPVQVVFGLHSPDDTARPVIEGLLAERPDLDGSVVIDPTRLGTNPKNCNLANMMPSARHELLVIVDSDILVEPHFLATIVAALDGPGIGASTCMYKAAPEANFASRLGALYINDWFIPSVMVDITIHGLGITYGAAAAVRRQTLEAIGGFAGMASAVAQDYVLGHEIRKLGLKIALAPTVVTTVVAEDGLSSLRRREMRWMRAIRAVRPLDHLLWLMSSALVPLVLLTLAWPAWAMAAAIGTHLGLRVAIHLLVRRRIALPKAEPWMIVFRELTNFQLWLISLLGRRIRWGNNVMITGGGLSMRADPNA